MPTDCPRCHAENLTDYPVCPSCAPECHFTDRPCAHCVAARIEKRDQGDAYYFHTLHPIAERLRAAGEMDAVQILVDYYFDQIRDECGYVCTTCQDTGTVTYENARSFSNPEGDVEMPCPCLTMREAIAGDRFAYTVTDKEIPF